MWFYLALFFAVYSSISTIIVKKLTKSIHPFHLSAVLLSATIPFMIVLVFLTGGLPETSISLYAFMFVSGVLDAIAFTLTFYALLISPISIVTPIASITPVFTTLFAAFTLNEIPTPVKLTGILLIVIGMYVLNIVKIKHGFFLPIQKLFSDRGVQLYFVANLIFAVTPIFQKLAIQETIPQRPIFPSLIGMVFVVLIMVIVSYFFGKKKWEVYSIKLNAKLIIPLGLLSAIGQLAAYTAFSQAELGYVTSVFRLSTLFTVLAGGIIFKEKNLFYRFIGAFIMVIGAICLLL